MYISGHVGKEKALKVYPSERLLNAETTGIEYIYIYKVYGDLYGDSRL